LVVMESRLPLFPIGAMVNKEGRLVIGGCDVVDLAGEYGTPRYVFDEATLRGRCREFKNEFGQRYADTTVIYASKAFLNRSLAAILKEEGLGLDVVSAGELAIAGSVEFPMDMVYLHGNNKSAEELRLALKHHIGCVVVDNFDELRLLGKLAEEGGHIPDIMLRITPGVDPHTHVHVATGVAGSKFGFPIFGAEQAVVQAMSTPSLNLIGLHFHIGSLIAETHPYQEAIEAVLDFAAEMGSKHGFELEGLDIGGGFSVQYTLDTPVPAVSVYAEAIVSQIIRKCRQLGLPSPMLTLEPGRAIVAQAGVALYRVGMIKEIPGLRRYVSVDGGMADNIRPALYGARYEAVVANSMLAEDEDLVTIAGKFCESGDILVKDVKLAPASAGDVIAVPVCGAYCLPMASNYNASLRPAVVMVSEGKARLVRRRETIADLVRHDLL